MNGEPGSPHGAEKFGAEKSVAELLSELWELVKAYVRQETLDPIKGVGRFVAFGSAGAALLGTGVVLLAVGGLRALQSETDATFTGNLTWAPYAIVFLGLLVGGGLSLAAVGRSREGRRGETRA